MRDYEQQSNGYFILHDMDQKGIPELLIFEATTYLSGVAVYTFRDGEVASVNIYEIGGLFGSFFITPDDNPGFIEFHAIGSTGRYRRIVIDGDSIAAIYDGVAFLTDAGWDMNLDDLNYEWYDLTINGETVTTEKFEHIFGPWGERNQLIYHKINETSIHDIIFGY